MHTVFTILNTSIEQTAIFATLSLGLVISFRIVRFPDLTVDGSFLFGASACATFLHSINNPWLALLISFTCGALAGLLTGVLSEKLNISRLLSGILVMTSLYSISLRMMGRANLPISQSTTLVPSFEATAWPELWNTALLLSIAVLAFVSTGYFLYTEIGIHLRAVGDNAELMTSLGRRNTWFILFGLALSNALIGFSGGLAALKFGAADMAVGTGMLIAGLACLYVGDAFMVHRHISKLLAAALAGTFAYCTFRALARQLNINAADLKGFNALLVVIALVISRRKQSAVPGADDIL